MKKLAIVGFGRFGQVLYDMFKDDFELTVYARDPKSFDGFDDKSTNWISEVSDIFLSEIIVYAVPIGVLDQVVKSHAEFITSSHIVMDVASVKLNSKQVFEKYLPSTGAQAMLTHPMFGPDSIKANGGLDDLPFIIDQFTATDQTYQEWLQFLKSKNLRVIEMSADEHDRIAANSQGLTHFIGRLLGEMDMTPTEIDTLGTKKLYEVMDQTLNDSWELFVDLQNYNPYTKEMRIKIGSSYEKVYNKLLPKQISADKLVIGIQGGKGSFNEEAVVHLMQKSNITNFEIKYLYTSEGVLSALHKGDIDRGQFAMHNSIGGVVTESVLAMADYKFTILEEFAIEISHSLMIKKGIDFSQIDTIITHPQVLRQCQSNLHKKYPHLKQTSGTGILVDSATAAKALSEGEISDNHSVMGSKIIAKIYDLQVIETNLQDASNNLTSFLFVSRKD